MNTPTSPRDARRLEITLQLLAEAEQAIARHHSADAFLAQVFRSNRQYGSKDRRFYSAAIFAWFRWKGLFTETPNLPREQAVALAYALDGNPPDAAFSPWNDPSDPISAQPQPVAEKIRRLQTAHPECAGVHPEQLVPAWVTGLLADAAFTAPWLDAIQTRPPTWLRLPRAGTSSALVEKLRTHLPDAAIHAGTPQALCTRIPFNLNQLLADIQTPGIEIQDLASQAAGLVCRPQPGHVWWDVCAASGGKALHLADLMAGRGTVVATDIRPQILQNLQQRAKRARMAEIHTAPVESIAASGRLFDGVLVDAPCSGLGTWGRNPDARWRLRSNEVAQAAETQIRILEQAQAHVKPGGSLVYSVCTLTRAETMPVIQSFLERHTAFALYPFAHPLRPLSTDGTCFILPWQESCNGMFIARLRRRN